MRQFQCCSKLGRALMPRTAQDVHRLTLRSVLVIRRSGSGCSRLRIIIAWWRPPRHEFYLGTLCGVSNDDDGDDRWQVQACSSGRCNPGRCNPGRSGSSPSSHSM